MPDLNGDPSLVQVADVATLPGIVRASFAMPDVHWGYGFPIGGVAATDIEAGGVVSPGGVGFDISCGVRLLVVRDVDRAGVMARFGDFTTGAESDLDTVTQIARQMVGRWGMSPAVGPIAVLPPPGQEQTIFDAGGAAAATRELVDAEVRRVVEECYAKALDTLREHREHLDRLASRLLEVETLNEQEARDAAGLAAPTS